MKGKKEEDERNWSKRKEKERQERGRWKKNEWKKESERKKRKGVKGKLRGEWNKERKKQRTWKEKQKRKRRKGKIEKGWKNIYIYGDNRTKSFLTGRFDDVCYVRRLHVGMKDKTVR